MSTRNLLITPTYAPDLERCRLLVESSRRYLSGVEAHLLLIDASEQPLFQPLTSSTVQIVCKEDLLPWWVRRSPLSSRWWLSLKSLPVRGWIMQQVIKLAIAEHFQADTLLFADSDMVFVRPFQPGDLYRDGKLRQFRAERGPVQYRDRRYRNWYRMAAELCGIVDPDSIQGSYIAQLNSWRHDNVIELYRLLESGGEHWLPRMLRCLDFSEFVLYGTFVEYVLGEQSGHYLDNQQVCHSSWFYDIDTQADVDHFVDQLDANHFAMHLQSNLGLSPGFLDSVGLSP